MAVSHFLQLMMKIFYLLKDRRRLERKQQQNGLRLNDIVAITDTQQRVFDSYLSGQNIMYGVAGTGKHSYHHIAIRDIMISMMIKSHYRLFVV